MVKGVLVVFQLIPCFQLVLCICHGVMFLDIKVKVSIDLKGISYNMRFDILAYVVLSYCAINLNAFGAAPNIMT